MFLIHDISGVITCPLGHAGEQVNVEIRLAPGLDSQITVEVSSPSSREREGSVQDLSSLGHLIRRSRFTKQAVLSATKNRPNLGMNKDNIWIFGYYCKIGIRYKKIGLYSMLLPSVGLVHLF